MVVFHKLHLPVLGGDLQLQGLHFSMRDVVKCLDRILHRDTYIHAEVEAFDVR